jgi:hypothetical protein
MPTSYDFFFRSSPTLRHSFATYYSSQVLISYIARHPEQDQLGHTDLRTTQIYTHILVIILWLVLCLVYEYYFLSNHPIHNRLKRRQAVH